jgi:hypothetical protein
MAFPGEHRGALRAASAIRFGEPFAQEHHDRGFASSRTVRQSGW